ncbi:uncharacterized protein RCC_08830 [Ramularia collo-cygni]|uniref:Uncharacterized protein n=1 Tax=Ramularia collo-cygni TaxID=112498 RepID=A0A2D3V880_9PEZI|nr:uncharacterized protein RCC_08830 [Ramularia collo-cygni]CZT23120.1 uncharacterized protein RCC_08830 [Ramularia collo-cygni]
MSMPPPPVPGSSKQTSRSGSMSMPPPPVPDASKSSKNEISEGTSSSMSTPAVPGSSKTKKKKNKSKKKAPNPQPAAEDTVEHEFYASPIQELGFDTTQMSSTQFRNTARQTKPASPPTSLPMVHYATLFDSKRLDGHTVRSAHSSERFIGGSPTNAAAYEAGGYTLRLYFPATETSPAHFADCMVCDPDFCRDERCRAGMPARVRPSIGVVQKTPSVLPFVHWGDCSENEKGEIGFYPGVVSDYSKGLIVPGETREMEMEFHNGFEKMMLMTRVCMEDCFICEFWGEKAKKAVAMLDAKDKKKAEKAQRKTSVEKAMGEMSMAGSGGKVADKGQG